jgi:hypothetical protein
MNIVDSSAFSTLTRFWEKLLSKPKEVALSAEYLPNLLPAAIGAFKAYRRSDDDIGLKGETERDADVAVRLLRDAFRVDPVVALLRWEVPDQVGRLEGLLAEEVVDAVEVPKALRALRTALSSKDLMRRAIATQLGSGEGADLDVLRGAAVVLACRNVGRFPESQMKNLLKRSFARAVFLTLLEEHADRIRREPEVAGTLKALEKRAIRAALARDGIAGEDRGGGSEPGDADLFALFEGGHRWRRSAYRLLALARRLWSAELSGHGPDPGGPAGELAEAVARLTQDREAQRRMAREVIVSYAAYAFRERFGTVVGSEGRRTDPLLGEAAGTLERMLGELGVSNWPELFEDDPESFPPTTTRSAFALSAALPIALSEACAESYASANGELVARMSERLGERLTDLLAEEPELSGPIGTGDAEAVCAAWSARRRLHREAGAILAELKPSLEEHLRHLSRQTRLPNVASGDRFWSLWRRNYAGEAYYSSRVPWDAVGDACVLERAVVEATSRFGGARDEYLVVFRVEGIRPQGMNWPMANVSFYDPEHFDYGEGLKLTSVAEDSSAFCHAAVRVSADTPAIAVRSARQRLVVCLDCYSFGLSGNSMRPDFNPKVPDGEYVANLSEERGGFSYHRTVDSQDEQRAADLDLPRMARAYAPLLEKAAKDPQGLTQLQDRFVRAVHWLREARFEADPAKRFVLHYVGMEHIFARGEGSDAVARRAPKLNKTWRNIGNPLVFPGMAFRSVRDMLEEDDELQAIADGHLGGWGRDERVLFNPSKVRTLLDLLPEDRTEARRKVSDLLEQLESLAADAEAIARCVERLRDLQVVKVRRLQMLRNDVVHAALYQDERMVYYAREAYEILDDALDKMVGEALIEDPDCENIDQLIEKYDGQPWADS